MVATSGGRWKLEVRLEGAENRSPGQVARTSSARLSKWPDVLAVDQVNPDRAESVEVVRPSRLPGRAALTRGKTNHRHSGHAITQHGQRLRQAGGMEDAPPGAASDRDRPQLRARSRHGQDTVRFLGSTHHESQTRAEVLTYCPWLATADDGWHQLFGGTTGTPLTPTMAVLSSTTASWLSLMRYSPRCDRRSVRLPSWRYQVPNGVDSTPHTRGSALPAMSA